MRYVNLPFVIKMVFLLIAINAISIAANTDGVQIWLSLLGGASLGFYGVLQETE